MVKLAPGGSDTNAAALSSLLKNQALPNLGFPTYFIFHEECKLFHAMAIICPCLKTVHTLKARHGYTALTVVAPATCMIHSRAHPLLTSTFELITQFRINYQTATFCQSFIFLSFLRRAAQYLQLFIIGHNCHCHC